MMLSSLSDSPALLPALSFLRWKRGVPKNEFLIVESLERHGPLEELTFAALPPEARELEEEAADPITDDELIDSFVRPSLVNPDCLAVTTTADGGSRLDLAFLVAVAKAAGSTG